jgi:hypothetical protein
MEATPRAIWDFAISGVLLSWMHKWGEKRRRQGVVVIADDRLPEQPMAAQANLDQLNYLLVLLFLAGGVVNHRTLSPVQGLRRIRKSSPN